MPSHLSWIDFSEEDRTQMLDVVHLFEEKESRDELGLGSIRDAIADFFFPGTSTIQTRARYFLFVPWIYRKLEMKRVKSGDLATRARNEETGLIRILKNRGEEQGLIGILAGDSLKRLPSNIYWNGLGVWGIRLFPGNQLQYHRSVDDYYLNLKHIQKREDEEIMYQRNRQNWHPGLPEAPDGFPTSVQSLDLASDEAEYLRDRVLTNHGGTLLAHLLLYDHSVSSEHVWNHPILSSLPNDLRKYIEMARSFAEVMNGAALLYNLILAELGRNDDRTREYSNKLSEWSELISSRWSIIKEWGMYLDSFWEAPMCAYARIPQPTKTFVEEWVRLVILNKGYESISDSENLQVRRVRDLISRREKWLKRSKSRISNPRALELWSGAAGTGILDYRWYTVRVIVQDIINGLGRG